MLAIAGCSEDNTHPKVSPVDEPSADAVTILATIDAIPSATGDGEAYAPLWQEGDQIVVGYKGISYVYETYDAGNGVEFHPMALSLPADARGEVTAYFKAVDGVFAVGADQTGATLPMYAYAADAAPAQGSLGLHFKPLASVLSLTIGEEASKTISKITLEPVDPDGVEGHLAVSEAVVDPRTGAVTVGEDAAVSDILTMEIGEMSLVQAQTVNFLIASGTKVDGGLKATISCTDGSVFVKNLFEGQEVAFAGNCVGAATELFFRLRIATYEDMVNFAQECADDDNADGQPGNLISPVLNIPAGYDLLLTCKVAIWAAAPDQGMVGICEKNDGFWISKGTLDKIVASTKSYVSLDIPAYTWVEVTAVIPNPGAKANPAFFISTADSWFSGSSVKAGRWYIDDIKLVY